MKIVIVGGVAGGASAAARARRLSEDAEIVCRHKLKALLVGNTGMQWTHQSDFKAASYLVSRTEALTMHLPTAYNCPRDFKV